LARAIHDTLAQGFISIVTHLEAAEEELSPRTGSVRRHLDQALRAARENLVEARRLVAALRPEILEGLSLPEALRRLAAGWSEASGVPVEVNVTGDQTWLPQELRVALLRVAQEGLSNARKHARADRVTMTLSYLEDLALLDVQDDGLGFDPGPISSHGLNGGSLSPTTTRWCGRGWKGCSPSNRTWRW
jgi:signal transduction histidine kinase